METIQVYVKCPLDGYKEQESCSLVDLYKETGTTHTCQYKHECSEMKTHIINERNLNETI